MTQLCRGESFKALEIDRGFRLSHGEGSSASVNQTLYRFHSETV